MSGIYVGVDGKARKVKGVYIGIDGKARKIKKGYIGDENGVARLCWSDGKKLSEYTVGSIVYLNENGIPVEFYVAHHNYQSSLNGNGRTLLVRKDGYGKRQWNSSNKNAYETSTIDTWLNGEYKNLLDTKVKSTIGTTAFTCSLGEKGSSIGTLSRSVFLLSVTEMGLSYPNANVEGSPISAASTIRILYADGKATQQWTRSPSTNNNIHALYMQMNASVGYSECVYSGIYVRPCFTLPRDTLFDEETNIFKG